MSSDNSKAVFLSYASQDSDAAQRIAEALRAAQIEVWFDRSELVGGDAWDAKIRGQIASCALFVPVISANTQARGEGYFRLEWKLAVDRSHLMAHDQPFLLPVVIDATPDAAARVPTEFRAVQWTRLSDGSAASRFAERVRLLLGGEMARAFPPVETVGGTDSTRSKARATPASPKRSTRWSWAALAAVIIIGGVATFIATRTKVPSSPTNAKLQTPNSKPPDLPSDKSIAVLPFDNLSTDQENGFFADGIHEDVLTALQSIRELRVLSRTTMMQYRARGQKSLPQIARELGVAYILEGSVQRAANKVRVRAQLIDARTDRPLWALPASERELTDIFAVQAQLAKAIAAELKATISPQEKTLLERRPTQDAAAYDLFLKGREAVNANTLSMYVTLTAAETFLQDAVQRDPQFVEAWAALSFTHSRFYLANYAE